MKLVSIVLHNHLSHQDTTLELNGTRLAAIVGPNGAGKSALLEAIRYVLFDDARARTDQLVRLGETDMSATVEFDFDGQRYRAVRGRTSKGAGKSYLELAVLGNDGAWIPLTGDDIRDTQARIVELLGVDAGTFATAVFLGQGEANRFAEATAGERKRILGQVLGLEVYARAEARAREEARDLEARTSADRDRVVRLGDVIGELEPCRAAVDERTAEVAAIDQAQAANLADRARIQARLTELAAEIAKGEAATAELVRLERERTELADRYRREKATIVTAEATIIQAEAVIAEAADVDAAVAALPALRARVAELRAAEERDVALATEIEARRKPFDAADRALREQAAAWETDLRHAHARVTELVAGVNALEPVICEKCQHPNVVDQADVTGQLRAARAKVKELEASKPVEAMAHSRERVAIKRLEDRRAEAGWDPGPYDVGRERLGELERTAARAGEIGAARAAAAAAAASKADAEAELVRIGDLGAAVAERIRIATEATAGIAALANERDGLDARLSVVDVNERSLQAQRTAGERALAQAEASVARLEATIAERDALAASLAEADVDVARLRRLVTAFGVTGIPARVIEGVLPELTGYANELLGELRPGMALEIRAQREKKSGKGVVEALDLIVRDDVGERPLAVFSGGERMSVSLAIATALSRLVARRAGAAIRSLIVDEPDGLDVEARAAFGRALKVLAHRGDLERVILVSHHADLAEYADETWAVTKGPAGSVVELVA